MGLRFIEHQDRVYADAPLRSVLAQVRFDPIYALLHEAGITGFHTVVRPFYPSGPVKDAGLGLEVAPGKIGVSQSAPVWRFSCPDDRWHLSLACDFVSLETPRYGDFGEFAERLRVVLSALQTTLMPSMSRRIGLRKINAIEFPKKDDPASLAGVVRRELLGPLIEKFPVPVRGWDQALIFDEDLNRLVVRSALDGGGERPAELVLDMDYSTDTPHEIRGEGAVIDLLHHFSKGITSFFEWALTEDYKTTLRPSTRRAPA